MPVPTKADKLDALAQRSISSGRTPIEPVTLDPLPRDVVRAFPSLQEWVKRNNAKLADFVNKMNTTIPK